jgi:hypothetical protein
MKTLGLLAAAAAAFLVVPAASAAPVASAPAAPVTASAIAASAQVRVVVREDRRGRRWNRGHRRAHWRTVCTRKWRHGRSVRVCRKVRTWRR